MLQHVRDGSCRLVERVGPGDDDLDLAGFEEPAERGQVLAVHGRGHELHGGGAEPPHQDGPRHPGQAREKAAGVAEAVRNEHAVRRQHSRGGLRRVGQHVVEGGGRVAPAPRGGPWGGCLGVLWGRRRSRRGLGGKPSLVWWWGWPPRRPGPGGVWGPPPPRVPPPPSALAFWPPMAPPPPE